MNDVALALNRFDALIAFLTGMEKAAGRSLLVSIDYDYPNGFVVWASIRTKYIAGHGESLEAAIHDWCNQARDLISEENTP